MVVLTKTANDVFAPYNIDGTARSIVPQDAQVWGTEIEEEISASRPPLVIVFSGQSNAARISSSTTWSVPDNLLVWNNFDLTLTQPVFLTTTGTAFVKPTSTRGNVAINFAAEAARDNPTRPVYLIDVSRGGTPIANWLSGAPVPDMYAALKANIEAALAAAGITKIDIFGWWQGENDAASPSNYFSDFNTLVTSRLQLESWFDTTTPVIIYGIAPTSVSGDANTDNFAQYLQKCANHDPEFRMYVNTPRLPASLWADTLHATGDGYRWLGKQGWQSYSKGVGTIHGQEQGTFTPVLTFGGLSTGITYSSQVGSYTRIGRRYWVDLSFTLTSKGTATGAAEITGLPGGAIVSPNRCVNVGRYISLSGLTGVPQGFAIASKIQLFESGSASSALLTDAKFTNTTTLQVSLNYDTN